MNNNDNKIFSLTKWNCKYRECAEYCRKIFYESHRREIINIMKKLCQ